MRHIVVATDFSASAERALECGRDFAQAYGAMLHVVHVVKDLGQAASLDLPAVAYSDLQDALEKKAHAELDPLVARLPSGLETDAVVVRSHSPALGVLAYAQQCRADLLVLGTHGRGGWSEFVMGSVAQKVIRAAPCPVLTVRVTEHAQSA